MSWQIQQPLKKLLVALFCAALICAALGFSGKAFSSAASQGNAALNSVAEPETADSPASDSPTPTLTYLARMDRARWQSYSHILNCSMSQAIPHLGTAVFDHTAGSELSFYLDAPASPLEPGVASLRSEASTWSPDQPTESMATIKVGEAPTPIQLQKQVATQMLAELLKGKSPRFARRSWYSDAEAIEVGLSAATFRAAYKEYSDCRNNLMTVGFDELERSRIQFPVDDYELSDKHMQWLDQLAAYLTKATDVQRLYIDGHTDNTHITTYNIELSRKRAESVQQYLQARGVSPSMLTVRFHGERYPVVSNRTVAGRAKNRRVTMRVELADSTTGPWLARR